MLLKTTFALVLVILQAVSSTPQEEEEEEEVKEPPTCDPVTKLVFPEGNIHQPAAFPWLGVLKIHIHDGQDMKIAVTGVVLVKRDYALSSADDVARIPRHVLKSECKAMFIPRDDRPWHCHLNGYNVHPEYEFATLNTLALLELNFEEELDDQPWPGILPACMPSYGYKANDDIYALGYTDENQLLEKTVYRMEYVNQSLCHEFYTRIGNEKGRTDPTYYQCAHAVHNKKNCIWENGMVLASNTTKSWTLIGFGVKGAGCSGPSRFIDIYLYLPWIDSSTSSVDMEEGYRRKGGNSTNKM